MHALDLCPSIPHRSLVWLLRAALGRPVDEDALIALLRASDPEELVRIAVFNYVHVILSKAFDHVPGLARGVPEDLVIFLTEMRHANLRRNHDIGRQLGEIGRVFSELGMRGVALKGGAELLAPLHPDPAFRFLSDLDILVPEEDLDRAVARFDDLGAVSEDIDEINQRGHHHLAPLRHPDWPVPLELHRAMGAGDARQILSAAQVLAAARPSGAPGLDVPRPTHRLVHAVLHAQIDPPRYRDGSLSLRDLVEMEVLVQRLDDRQLAEARAAFSSGEARAAWAALDAARLLVFGDPARFSAQPPAARAWARRAYDGFGRPQQRRWARAARLSGYYARTILFDPERRRHYLRQVLRPGALRKAIAYQREKFRRNP